ncbi:diphthine--ammonia ligase [Candidatus Woesearchaeota archaeon]|nr:diphthine--ammonia ligase [Candidatus Woesearchaeota archaeon]
MCGIIGVLGNPQAHSQVVNGLSQLACRGRDGVGVTDGGYVQYAKDTAQLTHLTGENILGHRLHAVVDHVPQPLKEKGILVANCEIYNWQKLAQLYSIEAKNDAELLLKFLDKFGLDLEKMEELDGVFAFAYWFEGKIILARDLIGEKPIWYSATRDAFAFASEKKVLEKLGYLAIEELHPRRILTYNLETKSVSFCDRSFVACVPEHTNDFEVLKEETKQLLHKAILKRIPNQKFGILFSGGVDSTYLAKVCKDLGHDVVCYTAALDVADTAVQPTDLIYAQKAAEQLGLSLRVKKITLDQVPAYLEKIVPLIEDSNVVKVGVALPFFLACEMAKDDGCKVILSGLGSEEIFAGYERHLHAFNINQECIAGLRKIYERDLYRDDVVTMYHSLELRLPFLDRELMDYALKIPAQYKIREGMSKHILRLIAQQEEVPSEIAWRKKTAAQYGSRFDYALEKLASKSGFSSKSAYLRTFYPNHNLKLGVLFSGGKDSTYAAYIMKKQNYDLTCLITLKSKNADSFMFHTPAIEITSLQAQTMGLPLLEQVTLGEKERELDDLRLALLRSQQEYHIKGIITGAVFSTYQRDRIERICEELGLKVFSPLWHKSQEQEMNELFDHGFTFMLTAVAAEGLDASWLGRPLILSDLSRLKKLQDKIGLNMNGEGGEFESLVLDCPLFESRVEVVDFRIETSSSCSARLEIISARLVPKKN